MDNAISHAQTLNVYATTKSIKNMHFCESQQFQVHTVGATTFAHATSSEADKAVCAAAEIISSLS